MGYGAAGNEGLIILLTEQKAFYWVFLIALNNILWLMDEIKWNVNALISVMNIKPTLPLCSGVEGAGETSRYG